PLHPRALRLPAERDPGDAHHPVSSAVVMLGLPTPDPLLTASADFYASPPPLPPTPRHRALTSAPLHTERGIVRKNRDFRRTTQRSTKKVPHDRACGPPAIMPPRPRCDPAHSASFTPTPCRRYTGEAAPGCGSARQRAAVGTGGSRAPD